MDYSEKWGRDVEEAVSLALIDLRLNRDQVEVIVLEEPAKGFFGIGSKLAKVRVQKASKETKPQVKEEAPQRVEEAKPVFREEKKEERQPEPVRTEQPQRPRDSRPDNRPDRNKRPRQDERREPRENRHREEMPDGPSMTNIRIRPENMQEVTEEPALDFLRDVTTKMGLELEVKAMANEECLYFDISGKDSGSIIGKRGQTLDSIQYLTSLVVNKDTNKYTRVIVDAENYRQKREKTLEQLANRLADKVRKTGKSVRLEPMNPYERKVIHATLQKSSSVTTRSEGEEPYRRVIIEQK